MCQFDHEVNVLLVLENRVQLDDVRVRQLRHDLDFVLELVFHVVVLYFLFGNHLHGVEFAGQTRLHLDDFGVGTFSESLICLEVRQLGGTVESFEPHSLLQPCFEVRGSFNHSSNIN